MKLIQKMLFFNDKNISKQSVLWNMIASLLNAFISAYLLMIVTRAIGIKEGGIFAIASTLAYQLLTIGNYGMRNFQATDSKEIYSFKEYLYSRYITSILMIIFAIIMVFYKNYDIYKSLVVISFVLFKWIDALEDIYHGFYQLHNRLDVAGREQSYRYIISLLYFTICAFITKNLLISCISTFIISLLVFLFFNKIIKKSFNIASNFKIKNVFKLLSNCFPLFISSYLYLYICNSPKYAIDSVSNDTMQSYFSIIFMPVFVINLVSCLIYRPLLTNLAELWNNKKIHDFKKNVFKQTIIIICLTIIVMLGALLLGTQILGLIYNVNLKKYKLALSLLMIGGGLNAFVGYLLSIITIIRAQKTVVFGYCFVSVISFLVSNNVVKNYSILGASILYDVLTGLLCLYFLFIYAYVYKKELRK